MLRLISSVVLLTGAVALAAPVPKDDAGRIQRTFGTTHDPENDSTFKPDRDVLRIGVTHERRLLSGWEEVYNAPRAWREITGNFTATVRVSFPIRDKIPPKHEKKRDGRAGGGLVVWVDNDNFLTLTRDEHECDGAPGEFYRAEARVAGVTKSGSEYRAPSKSGFVRVERKGQKLLVSYSTDGKKWKEFGETEMEWGPALKVGVFAENNYKAPFEATFEGYTLILAKE